jgi:AbrB family looped-hinge helix DNA binding protein
MKQAHSLTDESDDACIGVKMYGSVVVGTKGQIVIPSEVRKALDIGPGDSLVVVTKHGKAIGLVKTNDLEEFMEYMRQEMDSFKATSKTPSESKKHPK